MGVSGDAQVLHVLVYHVIHLHESMSLRDASSGSSEGREPHRLNHIRLKPYVPFTLAVPRCHSRMHIQITPTRLELEDTFLISCRAAEGQSEFAALEYT
jgi:hypothetical protein